MKKKMDALTKAKLIYSGELMIFAIVFLVIAILKLTNVIKFNEVRSRVFNWITIFGGTWIIVDFFWALFSKKRRPRIALIDKIVHLPAGLYLVSFDLYCLITQSKDENLYKYGVTIVIGYLCLCYIFESIYHFFYPVPGLLDAITEEEVEENPDNSSNEEPEPIEEKPEEENNNEER